MHKWNNIHQILKSKYLIQQVYKKDDGLILYINSKIFIYEYGFSGGSSAPHQPPVCWVCSQPISGVFLQAKGKIYQGSKGIRLWPIIWCISLMIHKVTSSVDFN